MEERTKNTPTISSGHTSFLATEKLRPLLFTISATIGTANIYLKKSTESTPIPSAYSGREKSGFIPYVAEEMAANKYPFALLFIPDTVKQPQIY